jgi:DNA-binding SARP family transcriptional activator
VTRGTFADVMEFRILGPLEVVDKGRSLPLGGARQRALLTALLLRVNQVVSTDQLLDEVWSDEPPASGVRVVQVYVSQLRKVLGDGVIETRAPGYVLVAEPNTLDLQRFEDLVGEARKVDPAAAAAKLRDALALWRGAPLADVAYHSFAQTEIGRLEELRLSALEARIEADLRLGRHDEVVGELEALVAEHPLRERLGVHLMQALYRSGRQAEALEAYQHARNVLVEGLGIEPGRELRELEQAILRQDPSLDLAPDEEAGEDSSRGAFVGREAELEELHAGLEDALAGRGRLFLVVGEPGIGKSRLAEELMRRARARGARVLVGRCWEAGGAPAYWPWVQSLRA